MSQDGELTDALARLAASARLLKSRLEAQNEPLESLDSRSLRKVAELAAEVSKSSRDELRDNLVSIYPLSVRPRIDQSNASFGLLLIDSVINDIRDLIVLADTLAERVGLPITDQALLVPRPVLVPTSEVKLEIKDINTKLASIEGDIASLKVIGNQIGLVNVSIAKLHIKLDIAKAILAIKDLLDASGLSRVFNGVRRIGDAAAKHFQSVVSTVSANAVRLFESIASAAGQAFTTAQAIMGRAIEEQVEEARGGREWTDKEVKALIVAGLSIPDEAVPYARSLEFGYGEKCDLKEVGKLIELERLSLTSHSHVDLAKVGNLTNLKDLELDLRFPGPDLRFLSRLTNLRRLSIHGGWGSSPTKMPDKLAAPGLNELRFTYVRGDKFPNLSKVKSIRVLSLRSTRFQNWRGLSTATGVVNLNLGGSNLSDLSLLRAEDCLETIDIRDSGVLSCSPLRNYRKLERMWVSRRKAHGTFLFGVPYRTEVLGDRDGIIKRAYR